MVENDESTGVVDESLAELTKLLREKACIKIELIPGNLMNQNMKSYTWIIETFDQTRINIKLKFDHPEYISIDDSDLVKMTFTKTEAWLRSAEAGI